MKKLIIRKSDLKRLCLLTLTAFGGVGLLMGREAAAEGVSRGLTLCGGVLIPSLFPFMLLSAFALSSGVFTSLGRRLHPLTRVLFYLPGQSIGAIIFGLVGGYPLGASCTAELYKKGLITKNEAGRLFVFCVNPGPAFLVTAAGTMILGSAAAGYALLFSTMTASLITGVGAGIWGRKKAPPVFREGAKILSVGQALTASVEKAAGSIISVCGWVCGFCAFFPLIAPGISHPTLSLALEAFSEISTGLRAAAQLGGLPMTAAAVSFGGLCVMLQNLGSMRACGVKVWEYLAFRGLNALISAFIALVVQGVFPAAVYSSAAGGTVQLFSHCAPGSAALLIMAAALIFEAASKKETALGDLIG